MAETWRSILLNFKHAPLTYFLAALSTRSNEGVPINAIPTAKLATIVDENPHREMRHILASLKHDVIDVGSQPEIVEDALQHLLDTVRDHDEEEEHIMENIFYPHRAEHVNSHRKIVATLQNTIDLLHHMATSASPNWRPFHFQMEQTKHMIERHMREYDDPLLLEAAKSGH
jgi:hemerythrin